MIDTSKSPRPLCSQVATLVLLLLAANLHAQEPMSLTLGGAAEVPPVATSASGSGEITVLSDHSVSCSIKVSGMVPTMAHIHEAPIGKNGPAIITLSKTTDSGFIVPLNTNLTDAQYSSYVAGKLYINVHSAQYPDGEIRAQLLGKPMHLAH